MFWVVQGRRTQTSTSRSRASLEMARAEDYVLSSAIVVYEAVAHDEQLHVCTLLRQPAGVALCQSPVVCPHGHEMHQRPHYEYCGTTSSKSDVQTLSAVQHPGPEALSCLPYAARPRQVGLINAQGTRVFMQCSSRLKAR